MTEEKENCNFQQNYNVFGLDDKPCCYLYHKYCNEIDSCYFKRCKRLEQENKELKSLNKKICEDWEKEIKVYWNALEKIKDLCIHYKNTNDKCITNCYAHFIVTDLIQNKINEVLR